MNELKKWLNEEIRFEPSDERRAAYKSVLNFLSNIDTGAKRFESSLELARELADKETTATFNIPNNKDCKFCYKTVKINTYCSYNGSHA